MQHPEYRAALHEGRRNDAGGTACWFIRFLHSATTLDRGKVVWFNIPAGNSWFTDEDDHDFFTALVEAKRHVSIGFSRKADALGFLEILRPCEITK
jgi:hypothetical protein